MPPLNQILFNGNGYQITIVLLMYGMWNLDIFRYVLPPFCVSSHLKLTHIALLGYISVLYPLCLIVLSWVCVELHDRNFRPLVLLWRPLHRCFVWLRRGWDARNDIIDVFAAFLLLSYGKLMYQSVFLIRTCPTVVRAVSGNLSTSALGGIDFSPCGSNHFLLAIPAGIVGLLACVLVSSLVLYPIRPFRVCLSRCKLDWPSVSIFMEKYHSCYRDGLHGGRDMRSFSGLYFIVRILSYFYDPCSTIVSPWAHEAFLFVSTATIIALVKPYKKMYMNVLDVLLLLHSALLCLILSSGYSSVKGIILFIIILIPAVVFWVWLTLKVLLKMWKSSKCRGAVEVPLRDCLLYTSPSPRDATLSRMPSSA